MRGRYVGGRVDGHSASAAARAGSRSSDGSTWQPCPTASPPSVPMALRPRPAFLRMEGAQREGRQAGIKWAGPSEAPRSSSPPCLQARCCLVRLLPLALPKQKQ